MKKILVILTLFFTLPVMGQTEKTQKVQKKIERDNPKPTTVKPSVTSGSPNIYRPNYPVYRPIYNPYPTYYRPYSPPVYISEPAPIRKPKSNDNIFAVGLISSISLKVPSTLGVRGSLGNKKVYLFASFETMRNNPYEYYSNIDLNDVVQWGDDYFTTISTNNKWDVGVALKVNEKIYPTINIGNNRVKKYSVYYDEFRVLSNTGYYSINGGTKDYLSMVVGVDYHPNKYVIINTGFGFVGPPKINLGLQLKFQ
jgi:hypothetical protein